ncbi:hypothetical protein VIGAN_10076400, partial [Vigna angularis var. angularis]
RKELPKTKRIKKAKQIVLLDVGVGEKAHKKQSRYVILTRMVEAGKYFLSTFHIPNCCSLSFSFHVIDLKGDSMATFHFANSN